MATTMNPAAQTLVDLTGTSLVTAVRWMERAGFMFHGTTRGGYREFRHLDGSAIWIRPDGEVIRLGPRKRGQKHRQRYNQRGVATQSHSTGEMLAQPDR